ncbi:MAG: hypothetical protein ACE5KQ_02730 [Thermoplasmata archaeon]
MEGDVIPRSWKGGITSPLDVLQRVVVAALDHLDGTYRSVRTISLNREAKIFTVTHPLALTIRIREEGLRFWDSERRPASSLRIVPSSAADPAIRSFVLDIAGRLPNPPWQMTGDQRRVAIRLWIAATAISLIPTLLGLVLAPGFLGGFLSLVFCLLFLAGVVALVVSTILTHPGVVSTIQRHRWGRWIQAPERAALGWAQG